MLRAEQGTTAAKAASFGRSGGTAEAVPFPRAFISFLLMNYEFSLRSRWQSPAQFSFFRQLVREIAGWIVRGTRHSAALTWSPPRSILSDGWRRPQPRSRRGSTHETAPDHANEDQSGTFRDFRTPAVGRSGPAERCWSCGGIVLPQPPTDSSSFQTQSVT